MLASNQNTRYIERYMGIVMKSTKDFEDNCDEDMKLCANGKKIDLRRVIQIMIYIIFVVVVTFLTLKCEGFWAALRFLTY